MHKKILSIALLFAVSILLPHRAYSQLGVKAGIYTTNYSDLEGFKLSDNTGFHAGITYKFNILPVFTIQPDILYVEKKAKIAQEDALDNSHSFNLQFIQVPVSLQYGINLMLVRPYFQVVPYINYAIAGDFPEGLRWNDSKRLNGGIGLGGGVDIWKFQIGIRYNWDISKVGGAESTDPIYERYSLSKGRALEISAAFFF